MGLKGVIFDDKKQTCERKIDRERERERTFDLPSDHESPPLEIQREKADFLGLNRLTNYFIQIRLVKSFC